ncbi:hypothetical protein [Szabonella alba]|uniref:Uncharacterized protein n=1 Tax=Szabonella alba TaxID=2804194 RepID=A0A8K0V9I7_9RHOB|nr:hypothetical protein [Szabonella alba]MBL4916153.1 hypothetical protein [Szabonella alba]
MAKKTAAELKEEASALSDLIVQGRKRAMNYALVMGKEGCALEAHPTKGPDVMWRQAKVAAGGTRGTQGVMNVSGKLIELNCETEDFPGTLPKLFKRHLKERGLSFKVVMILPNGSRLDDGEDEGEGTQQEDSTDTGSLPETEPGGTLTEAPPEAPPEAPAQTDPMAELSQRLRDLVGKVRALGTSGGSAAEKLGKGLQAAASEIKSGNADRARMLLDAVAKSLGDLRGDGPPPPPPPPSGSTTPEVDTDELRRQLQTEFDGLAKNLETLRQKATKEVSGKVGQLATMFGTLLGQGDLKKAAGVLKLLGTTLTSELSKLAETTGGKVEDAPGTNPNAMIAEHGKLSVKERAALLDMSKRDPAQFAAAAGALAAMDKDGVVDITPEARRLALADLETARKQEEAHRKALAEAEKELAVFAGDTPIPGSLWETAHTAAEQANKAFRDFAAAVKDPAKMTEKERQETMVEAQRLDRLRKEAQAEAAKAKKDMEDVARQKVADAGTDLDGSKQASLEARREVEAKDAKRALVNALTFGPLSPGGKPPMAEADKTAFIEAFGKDGVMARQALDMAVAAPDPSVIARNVGMVTGKVADGFADDSGKKLDLPPEQMRAMGMNALRMGSLQGEDYFKGFDAYLKSGKQHEPDPSGGMGAPLDDYKAEDARKKKVALARTQQMGAAALDGSGKVNFDSPEAKAAMDQMLFHPGSLTTFTPHMTQKMAETKALFSDPAKGPIAQRTIDKTRLPGTDQPGRKASLDIVARTMGKPEGAVTDDDAKGSVLAAMMTPLSQGPVGSCFATAPVRAIRETDPLRAMEEYSKIARTGQFKAQDGFTIPANRRVPQNENVLMRSWEYSVATVTQEQTQGRKRQELTTSLMPGTDPAEGLDRIKDIVGKDWNGSKSFLPFSKPDEGVKLRLTKAIQQKMRFEYNAGLDATGGGGDGSSTNGVYQIFVGDVPLDSEAAFKKELAKLALEAAKEKPDSKKGKEIVALVNSQAFIDEVVAAYGPPPTNPKVERDSPWNLGGGGLETEASKVVDGGNPVYDIIMPPPGTPPGPVGARNKALLETIVNAQQNRGGSDMVLMGTTGASANHAFNTLPNDPSVAGLQPPDIGDKIDDVLIKPGQKIASTKLPAEQAAVVFEKTVLKVMDRVHPDDREMVMEALKSLPAASLSPAEIKAEILKVLTKHRTDKYVADREPGADPARIEQVRQHFEAANDKWIGEKLSNALTEEMRPPEVVIADTNWGGAEGQTLFVMVPDATTGELGLFKKDVFTGKLTPAGDNWSNAKWDTTRR